MKDEDLWALCAVLDRASRTLRASGQRALRLAPELEARGWPAGTLGGEGGRSADTATSVERDVLHRFDYTSASEWDGIELRLTAQLRALSQAARAVEHTVAHITAHASDQDRPNRSICVACGRVVDGYLRRGLCDADRKALERSGLDRDTWIAQQRTDRTSAPGDADDIARHAHTGRPTTGTRKPAGR